MSEAVNAIVETVNKPQAIETIDKSMGAAGTEAGASATITKNDEKIAGRLDILISREQRAISQERQAKAQIAELTKLRAELEADRARINEFDSIKKAGNAKLALEKLGMSYDEITKAMLADGQVPPEVEIKKLRGDLDGLKASQEQERQRLLDQQKQYALTQETKAIDDFKSEINTFITDNSNRYELINFDNHQDEVYELIDAHYTRTQTAHAKELEAQGKDPSQAVGKVMKIAEAADKIEEFYEKREIERKKLAKLQALWGAVPKESLAKAVSEARGIETKKPSPRTLTNNQAAQLAPQRPRPKTDDERVQAAIAAWRASKGA
jgi:hypothetical protein